MVVIKLFNKSTFLQILTDHKDGHFGVESVQLLIPYSVDDILGPIGRYAVIVGMSGRVVLGPRGPTRILPELGDGVAHEYDLFIGFMLHCLCDELIMSVYPKLVSPGLRLPWVVLRQTLSHR